MADAWCAHAEFRQGPLRQGQVAIDGEHASGRAGCKAAPGLDVNITIDPPESTQRGGVGHGDVAVDGGVAIRGACPDQQGAARDLRQAGVAVDAIERQAARPGLDEAAGAFDLAAVGARAHGQVAGAQLDVAAAAVKRGQRLIGYR
ncbi:hypothetical protein D3C71_1525030 [compost metagenome]